MSSMRRALVLANTFNLLAAIYFIIISIVALVQLRWYHQLTVALRTRNSITSGTSYFAFIILIIAALLLIALFVVSAVNLGSKRYVSEDIGQDHQLPDTSVKQRLADDDVVIARLGRAQSQMRSGTPMNTGHTKLTITNSIMPRMSQSSIVCSTLLYLISSISLVVVLVVWLLNTGELVRESIAAQLESAFPKYQFQNRSNHYSIAIDGLQSVNECCGIFTYSDYRNPQRTGLASGHYPGSCCGKNPYAVNTRVLCLPEEILRAKQNVSLELTVRDFIGSLYN